MIAFIVLITDAERRIPVQYAKRVVGRKMYGGQNTYIPIKVNMSGVMPIILAAPQSFLCPGTIGGFFPESGYANGLFKWFFLYAGYIGIIYFILIIGFRVFLCHHQYNPLEMSNNLRKNSGAIPGYRPGKPTVDYIKRVLNKVTLIGALFSA